MIKLIVGTKGSGKTKTMIDLINEATKTATGNVVVIEKSMQLTTSINHAARLVDVDEYKINGAEMLYGFVAGVLAGNYDITEMFIDGILKVLLTGQHFALLHFLNNTVYKGKALAVSCFHLLFIGQIHITLNIGCFLFLAYQHSSCLYHIC